MERVAPKLEQLRTLARRYAQADAALGAACGALDPIACTVLAMKQHPALPPESFTAAEALKELHALHRDLVLNDGMDADYVRAIWFPILNGE